MKVWVLYSESIETIEKPASILGIFDTKAKAENTQAYFKIVAEQNDNRALKEDMKDSKIAEFDINKKILSRNEHNQLIWGKVL